jgi:hypothetical protein
MEYLLMGVVDLTVVTLVASGVSTGLWCAIARVILLFFRVDLGG